MTLRVTIEIVPHGDELSKYTLHEINISNLTGGEVSEYVVELDTYKKYTDETPRIRHARADGCIPLAIQALKVACNYKY